MKEYFRPIPMVDPARPEGAYSLAGGWTWFTHAERLTRDSPATMVPAAEIPADILDRLTAPRAPIMGISFDAPRIMGILNVTPDSFSDGGMHTGPARALGYAREMIREGADLIDIGGESTRPGAMEVPAEAEIARTAPVIAAVTSAIGCPVSVDTRKAEVALSAIDSGAGLVNDVSGFTFDPALAPAVAKKGAPICVMHMQGLPENMQDNPQYEAVLLDIYDFLAGQIAMLGDMGVTPDKILIDPGIGFGKTLFHNLTLLNRISLFHGLGCPILLGVSRKGMIRELGHAPDPLRRTPGSIAVGLAALAQGVQMLRVHDVGDTKQAIRLWQAVTFGNAEGALQ